MNKLKISVTMVDTYIAYCNGLITTDQFIERVEGRAEVTEYMQLGQSFHDIIEHGIDRYDPVKECYVSELGHEFPKQSIDLILQGLSYIQNKEISRNKIYQIGNYDVDLRGRADGVTGNKIIELKSIWKSPSKPVYDKFFRSFQWRLYLDIFDANDIIYYVFKFNKKHAVTEIYRMEYHRYGDMNFEITHTITQFIELLERMNLLHNFEVKL